MGSIGSIKTVSSLGYMERLSTWRPDLLHSTFGASGNSIIAGLSNGALASGIGGTLGGGLLATSAGGYGPRGADPGPTMIPVHNIYEDLTPEIYQHTKDALNAHPEWSELTYNGGGEAARINRNAACRGKAYCLKGRSRDEFPYATTQEGGCGAWVRCASVMEQQIQAGQLRMLYSNMEAGDRFKVNLLPKGTFKPALEPLTVPKVNPIPAPIPALPGLLPILIRLILL
jgi:hypothetical protein